MYKLLILLVITSIVFAEDGVNEARDLRVTMFSEGGNLIRKLTALSASGPVVTPILEGATVEFYGDDTELRILAILGSVHGVRLCTLHNLKWRITRAI